VKLAFAGLYECVGDLPIQLYRREHANQFRAWMVTKDYRTATVRRRLGVVRAVFNTAIRERELAISNVFHSVRIPDLGEDAVWRSPFTADELTIIAKACREKDDDVRWVVAMMFDTGARLAEIVGASSQRYTSKKPSAIH
jgi:integrase